MGNPISRHSALPLGSTPSPVCSVDPRLWYVSPSQLCQRRDLPVSVTSPALERLAIQVAAISGPGGRSLYESERQIVRDIFGNSVDAQRVSVVEARVANAPTTLGNQIRITPGFDFLTEDNKAVLIHEMTHIWQYQTHGSGYITDALYHQLSSMIQTGTRNAAYMNYELDDTRDFSTYSAEEQATIIEDYYQIAFRYKNDPAPPSWVEQRRQDLPYYERLVGQVRQATPLQEIEIYQRSMMQTPGWSSVPVSEVHEREIAPLIPLFMVRF